MAGRIVRILQDHKLSYGCGTYLGVCDALEEFGFEVDALSVDNDYEIIFYTEDMQVEVHNKGDKSSARFPV